MSVSTCSTVSPYIISSRGSTVCRLESLPRLPSQHREQSEALYNPAECTSHICLPASHNSSLIFHFNPTSLSFIWLFLGGRWGCVCIRLMLFVSFIVVDSLWHCCLFSFLCFSLTTQAAHSMRMTSPSNVLNMR